MRTFTIDGHTYTAKHKTIGATRREIHIEGAGGEDDLILVIENLVAPTDGLLQAGGVVSCLTHTVGYLEQFPGGAWVLMKKPLMERKTLGVTVERDILAGAELLCRYWSGDMTQFLNAPQQLKASA